MGEDNYSQEQKEVMFDIITTLKACPTCFMRGSLLLGPKGGFAANIKCSECQTVYFITPFRGVGAYPV